MKTKSNNNPSKLQSEAVNKLNDLTNSGVYYISEIKDDLETLFADQIQKAYSKGREEEHKLCIKTHLSELERWCIYDPTAPKDFEENYLSIQSKKNKMKQKHCESCQQFGKGTCNAFKCIARDYCDWEEIKKPKTGKVHVKDKLSINMCKPMQNTSNLGKPKELDWEKGYDELYKNCLGYYSVYLPREVKDFIREQLMLKGLQDFQICREELTQQRTELLEEYFEKEDNLIDDYANLRDGDWVKFLEARSKLKINLLNKKDE